MCNRCSELDEKIDHYRMLAKAILDQLTIERLGEMIAELVAEKAQLHLERGEQAASKIRLG